MLSIEGTAVATAEQMESYLHKINPSAPRFARTYLEEGEREGIRGDVAFAQSLLETGNFTFVGGTAVTLSQNNFCGLGVTSKGMKGHSFATPEQGILAQIQHLKAYANNKPLNTVLIDPRFRLVSRGSAPWVEWLGIGDNPAGKGWAAGSGYGNKIITILNKVLKEPTSVPAPKSKGVTGMKIMLDPGHGAGRAHNRGSLIGNEGDNNRRMAKILGDKLKAAGHTVGYTTLADGDMSLKARGQKAVGYDMLLSVHSNAGRARGTELWTHVNTKNNDQFKKMSAAIANALNIPNRGVKQRRNSRGGNYYGILAWSAITNAAIIEFCFHDNLEDVKAYTNGMDKAAAAIVETLGWAGKKPATSSTPRTSPTPSNYKLGDREIWWNSNKLVDKGEDVKELQRLLVGAGYDITVDGSFGPATENAVIAFQKAVNIKDNGVVGKQTIAALSAYIKEGIEDVTREEVQKMIDDAMKRVEGIAIEAIKKVEAERQGLPASEWSENAIVYAQENGIMVGDGQGNFKPKSYPTREELAQVIYNYDHKKESDKPPESPWSKVFQSLPKRHKDGTK